MNQSVSVLSIGHTRFWEIDALRGLLVILMIVFHLMWDLQYMGLSPISVFTSGWQLFARSIGSGFTFLLGVAVALRAKKYSHNPSGLYQLWLRRSAILFGLGMLITLATSLVVSHAFVIFGIIHMQSIALLLAALCVRRPLWFSSGLGLLMLALGFFLNTLTVSFPWLIWLGVMQYGRSMVDYYPLLPWSGFALLGVAAGTYVYGHRKLEIAHTFPLFPPLQILRWLGRRSLAIYFLHQPVLLGSLLLLRWLQQ